jgi:peptidoglycan/LPS O-acetylase OafA/YrhL
VLAVYPWSWQDPTTATLGPTFTAVLAAAGGGILADPGAGPTALLACGPLATVGVVSYGIYLWHVPVVFAAHKFALAMSPWVHAVATAPVIGGLAVLSYVLAERPLQRIGRAGRGLRTATDL